VNAKVDAKKGWMVVDAAGADARGVFVWRG